MPAEGAACFPLPESYMGFCPETGLPESAECLPDKESLFLYTDVTTKSEKCKQMKEIIAFSVLFAKTGRAAGKTSCIFMLLFRRSCPLILRFYSCNDRFFDMVTFSS